MNQILALILKEGKVLVRDRQALALLFAMPIFFILVMNFALEGVFEAGGKIRPVELLVIDGDEGILGKQILADLKKLEGLVIVETADGSPLSREKADHLILQGKYPLALLIPPDFSRQALQSSESNPETKGIMTFVHDPAMNARLLAGIKGSIQGVTLRRTLTARMAHRLKETLGGLALQSPLGLTPFPGLTNSLKALEGEGAEGRRGESRSPFSECFPARPADEPASFRNRAKYSRLHNFWRVLYRPDFGFQFFPGKTGGDFPEAPRCPDFERHPAGWQIASLLFRQSDPNCPDVRCRGHLLQNGLGKSLRLNPGLSCCRFGGQRIRAFRCRRGQNRSTNRGSLCTLGDHPLRPRRDDGPDLRDARFHESVIFFYPPCLGPIRIPGRYCSRPWGEASSRGNRSASGICRSFLRFGLLAFSVPLMLMVS